MPDGCCGEGDGATGRGGTPAMREIEVRGQQAEGMGAENPKIWAYLGPLGAISGVPLA